MSREVRRVPANWQHPRQSNGEFRPLLNGSFFQEHAEAIFRRQQWDAGLFEDWHPNGSQWFPRDGASSGMAYEQYYGQDAAAEDYMPEWPEDQKTHWQMYETTTEGTPISPVMESPEALARWLADTGASAFGDSTASYDAWLATIRAGSAPGLVIDGGTFRSGVEQAVQRCSRILTRNTPMTHDLKSHPGPFKDVVRGWKTFEIRKNDRDFRVDDRLHLQEWDPARETYTGRDVTVLVTHLLPGGAYGVPADYCIMSIQTPLYVSALLGYYSASPQPIALRLAMQTGPTAYLWDPDAPAGSHDWCLEWRPAMSLPPWIHRATKEAP